MQASQTLSQDVVNFIGPKTLGMNKLAASKTTDAQKRDYKQVAKGWKIQCLDKSIDSVLASATRLEKEIEHETKYWKQVLAVSEKGWAVCRLPNQTQTLGVRFGFSESSPAFKSRSLAALNRKPDGTISLGQGSADAIPKTFRVRIRVGDECTGSSMMPKAVPQDSPVETLILQARNTIFAEELWQELNRESRTMELVKPKDDALVYQLSADKAMVLDLVSLEEESIESSGPDGALAQSLFFTFNILLSYAHRQAHHARSRVPPPISSEKRPNPPLKLFRPFIARARHQESIAQLQNLFRPLYRVLVSASLPDPPAYTLVPTVYPFPSNLPVAERTIRSLTDRLEVVATFTITPKTIVTVRAQTLSQHSIYTQYLLSISPSDSPLHVTCPAFPITDSFSVLKDYIYYATSCALASMFVARPRPPTSPSSQQEEDYASQGWSRTAHPNILQKAMTSSPTAKQKQLAISVGCITPPNSNCTLTKLHVQWDFMRGEMSGEEALGWTERSSAHVSMGQDVPGVGVGTAADSEGRIVKKEPKKALAGDGAYTWLARSYEAEPRGQDDEEGSVDLVEVVKSLVDVVRDAGK